ncbi:MULTISPECIES: glycosyltransferase family 2 protein [Chryseobacterium]|uniref:Glycosyltransferase involved in cell wall biosynthesis n=1 Tax=Chryseobacterium camelliae TaxID=1265445 RepID=A0ABU0TPA6_9FLAO|nr:MULTISPECIES: glycosyltransferase family 2 protein [Chryseobacterium]MDT3407977.1 glycosyltransferase involved in cell wall biosynthesis [Pseudacidovorax intermedius]MDQ1098165.1 glycosyltransferase involved in cell wall biosynthesis [Chryseobacterium camelliae]MDQ1102095.1 glycosyltransferase involved in cell wall biosynthesis [Chryseobacterium sp. SORGH_AS_1048]MDR6085533.1 glycosyltransferase involved in cell wall biosynthesis [Chryseobacterium sp. SORGH_AS_0909]MDR6129895.1 glycosyltran
MKISVCIPVYNFDVRELVAALNREIYVYTLDAEIILIDDASENSFSEINRELVGKVHHFVFLKQNIGRSRIRNRFIQYAVGDYLLFLDCDVRIDNPAFLRRYIAELRQNPVPELIYGNFKISEQHSGSLRNRYSVAREIFSGERSSDISIFKTVNFAIKKEVLIQFPFNEDLTGYGYEDYVFAKLLEKNGISFLAFNNPVIHVDDTDNAVFLKKTEVSMDTLYGLMTSAENSPFIQDIRVYRAATKLKKLKLDAAFLVMYGIAGKILYRNLVSENPKIRLLDIYKLALLLGKMK